MRIAALILSCYVLLLAFMPCGDEPEPRVQAQAGVLSVEQITLQADTYGHQHGEDCQDFCTPFCHCHCCHTHVTVKESSWQPVLMKPFLQKVSMYAEVHEQLLPYSIFQPPRLLA